MASLTSEIVISFLKNLTEDQNDYEVFIESGTKGGTTIMNLISSFKVLHTIELSENYYNFFDSIKKEQNYTNVVNHLGATENLLSDILQSLNSNERVVFWLDGHWSSFDTARGEKDCPLLDECSIIDSTYKSNKAVILIDDYRLFGTNLVEDWSEVTLKNVISCFKNHSLFYFIRDDILAILIEKNVNI
jgi:hypothetical protein